MHAEEESLSGQRLSKDHSWRIVEISWVLGFRNLKKKQIKNPLYHHMLFGRVFKKNCPHSSKNKLQQIQLSDTTGTSNGTGFYCQMKLKKSFLAANPPDEFSTNRDKKSTPCPRLKYTAGSLMLWACFFCQRSWTSCSDAWHHGFYQIPTDKKSKPDCLC